MTPRQITNHKRRVLAAIRRENVKQRAASKPTRLHESQRKPESELKGHYVIKPLVPQDVLMDRDHRAELVPLTLTAALCGDPPRGYSELDRRSMQP